MTFSRARHKRSLTEFKTFSGNIPVLTHWKSAWALGKNRRPGQWMEENREESPEDSDTREKWHCGRRDASESSCCRARAPSDDFITHWGQEQALAVRHAALTHSKLSVKGH